MISGKLVLLSGVVVALVCYSTFGIAGDVVVNNDPAESKMQAGFSWVIDESLAGMSKPGTTVSLEDDFAFLRAKGIDLLFTLTEAEPDTTLLAGFDVTSVHLPVIDYTAPSMEQLSRFVQLTDERLEKAGRVGIHCHGGMGRTGTFLAAYFVSGGLTADEAIVKIRMLRPGSIETKEQEDAVHQFQALVR